MRHLAALGLTILVAAAYMLGWTVPIDNLWFDFLSNSYSAVVATDPRIVTVRITESTADALGVKSPIPRKLFLDYLEKVHRLGAEVQGINHFFLPSNVAGDDERLLETARNVGKICFAVKASLQGDSFVVAEPLSGKMDALRYRLASPYPLSSGNAVRRIPPRIRTPGHTYRSLAEEAFLLAGHRAEALPEIPAVDVRDLTGRFDLRKGPFIDFVRPRKDGIFESLSFEDVLTKEWPADYFRGKIVLVGNYSRTGQDGYVTPQGYMPGCELQGMVLRGFLDGTYLTPLPPGVTLFLIVALGAAGALAFTRLRPAQSTGLLLFLTFTGLLAGIGLYRSGIFAELSPPLLAVLASYVACSLVKSRELEKKLDASEFYMREISAAGERESSTEELLSSLVRLSCLNLAASSGWIQVLDRQGTLSLAAAWPPVREWHPEDLDGGVCRRVVESGAFEMADTSRSTDARSAFERAKGAGTLIAFPVKVNGAATGAMAFVAPGDRRITPQELKPLYVTAGLAGALIENDELNRKVESLFIEAVDSLAQAVEARDPYTYGHSARVAALAEEIARRIPLPPREVRNIRIAGLLHDIGKIGVPEAVLQKKGKLTDEEFALMKRHPEVAVKILQPLEELYSILALVAAHHEKLDGTGYPAGAKGDDIAPGAKILAVADVYDALTSKRPYRESSTPEEGLAIMNRISGSHLDARLLGILESCVREAGGMK